MLVASAEDNLAGVGHAVAKGRLTGVCPLWTTSTASGSLSLWFYAFLYTPAAKSLPESRLPPAKYRPQPVISWVLPPSLASTTYARPDPGRFRLKGKTPPHERRQPASRIRQGN
ncbi:hypothetical protein ACMYSQ_001794 [Aspergillus niger]